MRTNPNENEPITSSLRCALCGAENIKPHWHRDFPDIITCAKCFMSRDDQVIRSRIASELWHIRKNYGRGAAQLLRDFMKGSGVPPRRKTS